MQLKENNNNNNKDNNGILKQIQNGLIINFKDVENQIKIKQIWTDTDFFLNNEFIWTISYEKENWYLIMFKANYNLWKWKINWFGTYLLKYVITTLEHIQEEITICYVIENLWWFYDKVLSRFEKENLIENFYYQSIDKNHRDYFVEIKQNKSIKN